MATTKDFLKSLDSNYNKPRSTDEFLRSLGRNQVDTYRNSQKGRDEIDGVTDMDSTSAGFVRSVQRNLGSGAGDAARFVVSAPRMAMNGLVGGLYDVNGAAYQALGDVGEAVGLQDNWAQKQAAFNAGQSQQTQAMGMQNFQTDIGRDFGQGAVSFGATAPLAAATVVTRNPNFMAAGGGVQTGATTYLQDRQAGYNPAQALQSAIVQGGLETLGEALPAGALAGMASKGVQLGRVGNYAAGEIGGEIITQLGQDAARTAQYNNTQQGWQDYGNNMADNARGAAIGALVQGGGNLAMMPVANAARDAVLPQGQAAQPVSQSKAFADSLQAPVASAPMQPLPQTPVQPQQTVNPQAQANLLASIQEMSKPNSIFKTRTDVPTVQQLTGKQATQQTGQRPQEVNGGQAVQNTVNKIIGVESGGKANNPNPQSSANGLGQFIDSTWLAMMKKYRPDVTNGKSRGQILSLKTNPSLGREMTVRYVEENARALSKAELPVTEGNLYLAHFSGAGTAIRAIKANPNAPASSVYGADAINANKSILQGKTIGQVVAWANRKMGSKAAANYQGDQAYVDDGNMATPVESPLADTSMFDDDSGNEAMLDAAQAQREAAEEMQDAARKLGKQTTVRIGDEKADADMMLIDALDLSPSVAGTENQYRDRNRAASQIQVNKIANELDPEILGDSKLIDTGAPTLAADGKTIIGGNGRTMGILQAYEQGNGQQYKDYIANHAAEFGINPADVLGMERPVLVRKLRSGDIDVGKAAVASNENSGLAMSALEQARVDSGRLPNFGSLQFSDDGNLNIPANRNFIRDFVGQMPTTMQATMVDAQGNLSQDGYRRMQNAILHRAYGNTPALSRMVESSDQGTRNLLTAMMKSAPKIAAAKDAIKSGNMHDADIADDLVGAVETINQLRTEGRSVADYLAQQGMFAEDLSPVARELVAFLDDNIRSAKKISELIEAYYDVLSEQGSPNQDDIFGENIAPTKEKIYDAAKQQFQREHSEPEQSGIFEQQRAESVTDEQIGEPGQNSERQPDSAERDAESAGESESQVREPALFRRKPDGQQDIDVKISDIESAIQDTVGDLSRHIEVVSVYEMFPDDVAKSYIDGNAEGAYFPKDRKIYILAESVTPERAQWVAWHELGHRGFDTPQFKNYQSLVTQARNNPVIDALSKAIMKDRRQYSDDRAGSDINVATEEAIVELLAASKTGNYAGIEKRYGIKPIQPEFKTTLQRLLDKFKALMTKVTGRNVAKFSNDDVLDLLKAVEMAAAEEAQGGRDGEARLSRASNVQAEREASTFDEARQAAKEFQGKPLINEDSGIVAVVSRNSLDKMLSSKAVGKSGSPKIHALAVANADHLFENAVYGWSKQDRDANTNLTAIHRLFAVLNSSDGKRIVKLTVKETTSENQANKLYTLEAVDFNEKSPAATWVDATIQLDGLNPTSIRSVGDIHNLAQSVEDGNKNKGVLFSREQKQAAKSFFSKNEIGEWQKGLVAYEFIAEKSSYWLSKVGMARSTPAFTSIMRDYRAEMNAIGATAKEMADRLQVISEADRKLLSDVLELEVPQGVRVPEEVAALATAMREVFNQQSDDLVALKMLAPETANRWRDTYLPRIYNKHAQIFSDVAKEQKEMRKLMKGSNRINGSHLKGRGIFRSVPIKEQAHWESQGYEMREHNGKNVVMWRDYTRQERENMNENRDAGMRFTVGYIKTGGDIARAKMFMNIALNESLSSNTQLEENWQRVPDDTIPGTGGIKKFGALAGMYVHPEVHGDLIRAYAMDSVAQRIWLKVLGWWKVTKTVYNAVAHVNNVMSNMVMHWMAGGTQKNLGISFMSMWRKDALYREALEQGLIGDNVDVSGIKEMFVGMDGMAEDVALDNFVVKLLKRIDGLIGYVPSKIENATKESVAPVRWAGKAAGLIQPTKAAQAAQTAYQAEDAVFKLSLYKTAKDKGLSPKEAADYALTFMFDYTEIPIGVRKLRDTGTMPFISYTYKAVPALARLALTRPHRVLMVTAGMYAFNAMAYMLLGYNDEEDEEKQELTFENMANWYEKGSEKELIERDVMPDYMKGYSIFGAPKLLRLPKNDANGDPMFIDVYRWLPLGDFADTQNQMGGIPLPQWATPNGPFINHTVALLANKDTFTGRELKNDRMSDKEIGIIYAKYLAGQWLPASVGSPFSYHTNNVLDGMKSQFEDTKFSNALEALGYSGTNYRGEDVRLDHALPSALGVKIRGFSVEQMKERNRNRKMMEIRNLKGDITRIKKDNTLTESAKQTKIEVRLEQIERLKSQ